MKKTDTVNTHTFFQPTFGNRPDKYIGRDGEMSWTEITWHIFAQKETKKRTETREVDGTTMKAGKNFVDLSGYAAGAYYVHVTSDNGIAVRKLVVK